MITLSITTCKRLSLFLQTMDSFMAHCRDVELIDQWLLADHSSTTEDRCEMLNAYPMFRILTTESHAESRIKIFEEAKNDWLLYLEDDWTFRRSFKLKKLLKTAEVGGLQCLTLISWPCPLVEEQGLQFRRHKFDLEAPSTFSHDHHWPGYTSNPSLQFVPAVRECIQPAPDSERTTAEAFMLAGHNVGHLPESLVDHIGAGASAYDLTGNDR